MSTTATTGTVLLPFRPETMTAAQLAAVSYLARYSGHTHQLYVVPPRSWRVSYAASRLRAAVS